MSDTEAKTTESPKKKGMRVIVVCLLVLILAAGGTIIFLLLNSGKEEPLVIPDNPNAGGRGIVASPDNLDKIRNMDKVEDGYYEARMNTEWEFASWNKPSKNAYVANAESNTRTVYFDLFLAETDELIYSSPFIPVGSELKNFALSEQVKSGEHKAVAVYHLVDDDFNEITTVSVGLTLRIEK